MPPRRHTPVDKREHLSLLLSQELPKGARLAICLDPEESLADMAEIADRSDRLFSITTYREDDLAFRLEFNRLYKRSSAEEPMLVRVALPEFSPLDHKINLSFIADIIGQAECHPIDLRTDAVVTHYTEPVVWPAKLQQQAERISGDLPTFVEGYRRMRKEIGKNHPLAEYHISAALLMGKYKSLDFRDIDLYDAYPSRVVARAIASAARLQMPEEDRILLRDVLLTTSRQHDDPQTRAWLALPVEESARLVILGEFLSSRQVPNSVILLSSTGLFSAPVNELKQSALEVIGYLKDQAEDWQSLCRLVDETTDFKAARDTVGLLGETVPSEKWLELIKKGMPACLVLALAIGYLNDRLEAEESPALALPASLPDWITSELDSWKTPHHDSSFDERATALLRLIKRVARVQARLKEPVPSGATLDEIVGQYAETDDCRLELLLALARKDADALEKDEAIRRIDRFLTRLEQLVAERLDGMDRQVATVLKENATAYRNHPASSTRFLKAVASRMRNPNQRLFVWLFDGMRWDTWADVVRPVLETGFRIEEQKPLLTPVPTYTGFARTSFFAGNYPDAWRGFRGGFTHSEGELAARNVGITSSADYERQVAFVTQTDTAEGTKKLRKHQPRRYNFLVFNISDDNIHDEQGDLREVNNAIRQKVELDVLPEMKRIVEEGDIVIISSDHGFIQLDRYQEMHVKAYKENPPEVRRRYAIDREELEGVVVPFTEKRDSKTTTCVVGRAWYNRNPGRGYTRYDHGGISLSEMIVPGVVLHRATEPEIMLLEISAPSRLKAEEDQRFKVEIRVLNKGNSLASVRITIGELPPTVLDVSRGKEVLHEGEIEANITLKHISVTVEARRPDGSYAVVQGGTRQIPVTVSARKDKVEFGNALEAFDDLDED